MLRLAFIGLTSLTLLGGCATAPRGMHSGMMGATTQADGAVAPNCPPAASGSSMQGMHDQMMQGQGMQGQGMQGQMVQGGQMPQSGMNANCPMAQPAPAAAPVAPAPDDHSHQH